MLHSTSFPSTNSPRIPHSLSVSLLLTRAQVRPGSSSPVPCPTSPINNNHSQVGPRTSDVSGKFNPERKLLVLKATFVVLCILDILHWAYMLRDDEESPTKNTWSFYEQLGTFDNGYLIARMFGDIFTCVLGLGAAMWTRKVALTLPCLILQLLFILLRVFMWPIRLFKGVWPEDTTNENLLFVASEFILPGTWALLAGLIVYALRALVDFERLHGYTQPPMIVLTVKNDENDESVQIEIA